MTIDPDDKRADLQPGFWPNYREPTPLARAIQYPLADTFWQTRVLNAYAKSTFIHARERGGNAGVREG